MSSINDINFLKEISELQVNMISGGVIYLIIENDTFTWRKASKSFDLDIFQVGEKLSSNSILKRAIKENKTLIENIPRSLYGIRLRVIVQPLTNEKGEVVGAYSIVFPKLHPIAKSFNDFAPILSEMFAEGAVLYMTDLEKIGYLQSSRKFDIPNMRVGNIIKEDEIVSKVIKSKKTISTELKASKYGMPVLVTCCPIFDEDNPSELIATFGIILPKIIANNLRNISTKLKNGLSEIVFAVEQLVSSASDISVSQQDLNLNIEKILGLTEEINQLTSFIKRISDDTNMLGLNASIEAARAGEAGRGFSIVAKEIRNLSEQSKSSVPQIQKLTDNIKKKVDETHNKSKKSLNASQEQVSSSEEITANIEEITAMSEELNQIASEM